MLRGILFHFAANHLLNDTLGIGFNNAFSGNVAAIAQNCDAVAQLENFLHAVRDINDGNAALLQLGQQLKKILAFFHRKRTGRFIHDDDLRPVP